MRPEVPISTVLIDTARTGAREPGHPFRGLSGVPLDWPALRNTAAAHGLLPLLSWHAEAAEDGAVPPWVARELRVALRAAATRQMRMVSHLLGVHRDLSDAGVQVVPFKGPVLAQALYANPSLRPSTDLDLYVPRGQVGQATEVLLSSGHHPAWTLDARGRELLVKHWCQEPFARQGICVELHWDLIQDWYSFRLRSPDAPVRPWHVSLGPTTVTTYSPEFTLVYLCVHGAKHGWERLGWVADVHHLIGNLEALDWDEVERIAGNAGVSTMLEVGIGLARRLLGTPLSASGSRPGLDAGRIRGCIHDAERHLLLPMTSLRRALYRHRFFMRTMDRPRDRAAHVSSLLLRPSPADWERTRPLASETMLAAMRPIGALSRAAFLASSSLRERLHKRPYHPLQTQEGSP